MNQFVKPQDIIVSGIHLELTPVLKDYVREKVGRLLRHEDRIVRVRVELAYDDQKVPGHRFAAKGHIISWGPSLDCTVISDECQKSVDLLVDKLDRMLRRRSRMLKVKRKRSHPIELGVLLPKTV
ncbi:MAG: ribosomal subunit interface protein [Verrucomicrobia bacterium RIFCSPLOWO2_12_FULL_64_8]|nr:MAG: ribosomal subunit interface protein [Verrucomicrobia bacterium RIFCSPLOWO2_12_FULL_64_8]